MSSEHLLILPADAMATHDSTDVHIFNGTYDATTGNITPAATSKCNLARADGAHTPLATCTTLADMQQHIAKLTKEGVHVCARCATILSNDADVQTRAQACVSRIQAYIDY